MDKVKIVIIFLVFLLLTGCTVYDADARMPFNKIYQLAYDNLSKADSYSLNIQYSMFENVDNKHKFVSGVYIDVDNVNSIMKMNTKISVNYMGQTINNTQYIKQEDDKIYLYKSYVDARFNSHKVFTELNSNILYSELSNDVDIISNLNIDDLKVEKTPGEEYPYKMTISYGELNNNDTNIFSDLERLYNVDTSDLNDTKIYVYYIFDQDNHNFEEIKIDIKPLIKAMLQKLDPSENSDMGECYLTFNYDKFNEVEVTIPNKTEYIFDDAYNELYPDIYLIDTKDIHDTISGSIEYPADKDVFKIKVTEKNKYLVKFMDDNVPLSIKLYDLNCSPLKEVYTNFITENGNYQFKQFAVELDVGEYLLSTEYLGEITDVNLSYDIVFEELEDDDYADVFTGESMYPIETIDNTDKIQGSIDFIGDFDAFRLLKRKEDLVFINISSDDLFLIVKDGHDFREYYPEDGEIKIELKDFKESILYYTITSTNYVGDYEINFTYYNDSNDHSDTLTDDNKYRYTLGESFEAVFHPGDKSDVIELIIDEDGYYNFELNYYYLNEAYLEIYDSNLNKQYETRAQCSSHYLESGTHYLNIINGSEAFLYSLSVNKVVDDIEDYKDIDFSDNVVIDVSIDYTNDVDTYKFQITEPTLYNISFINNRGNFSIRDVNNHIVYDNLDLLSSRQYVFLEPGEYYLDLKYNSPYTHNFTLQFTEDTETIDDYMNSSSFESYMGVLNTGINEIYMNYNKDVDIYLLSIEKPGYYSFNCDFPNYWGNDIIIYFKDESGKRYDISRSSFSHYYLEEGNYYFTIVASNKCEGLLNIDFYDDTTASDELDTPEYNMSTNSFVNIKGQLNYIDDTDYYKIIVDESGVINFTNIGLSNYLSFYFIDENNNVLIHKDHFHTYYIDNMQVHGKDIYYSVKPGVYTLELTDDSISNYNYTIDINFNNQIVDDYDNSIHSTSSNFGTFNIGLNTLKYDYAYDTDVFIFEIEEDGDYFFEFSDQFYKLQIYNSNLTTRYKRENSNDIFVGSFNTGTYYIVVTGIEPKEVSLDFYKQN